jgi:hypothetical protein
LQPDPSLFLLGARRELLNIVQRGDIENRTALLAVERIAETLAQLAIRHGAFRAVVMRALLEQASLLRDATALLREWGANVEDPIREEASTDSPELFDSFEHQSWLLAARCRQLAIMKDVPGKLAKRRGAIFRAARRLEGEVRAHYRAILERLKKQDAERAPTADELARIPPSDEALTAYLRATFTQYPSLLVSGAKQLIGFNS